MFSKRLPASLRENAIATALAGRRRRGEPLIDLTDSNPVRAGLSPGPRELETAFDGIALASYEPDPIGLAVAREAVARYAAGWGIDVPPERIVLTSSTSEAYAHLFRLLANPGDDVLVPRPSYPLFEPLAALEGISVSPYPLAREGARWAIDPGLVRAAIGRRTRAIVVVDPNNPTGSVLSAREEEEISRICAQKGLALISDQVFAEFLLQGGGSGGSDRAPVRTPAARRGVDSRPLTFVLSGLSKVAGLPQLKLGWIVVDGPDSVVTESLRRLEWIADAFLSVGTPVQLALPRLLETRHAFRERTLLRARGNLDRLRGALAERPDFELLEPEGGWTAVIRVPRVRSEEGWALALLDRGVAVHPGHFYDFPDEAFLVVSLLPDPAAFAEGIRRLVTLG